MINFSEKFEEKLLSKLKEVIQQKKADEKMDQNEVETNQAAEKMDQNEVETNQVAEKKDQNEEIETNQAAEKKDRNEEIETNEDENKKDDEHGESLVEFSRNEADNFNKEPLVKGKIIKYFIVIYTISAENAAYNSFVDSSEHCHSESESDDGNDDRNTDFFNLNDS